MWSAKYLQIFLYQFNLQHNYQNVEWPHKIAKYTKCLKYLSNTLKAKKLYQPGFAHSKASKGPCSSSTSMPIYMTIYPYLGAYHSFTQLSREQVTGDGPGLYV